MAAMSPCEALASTVTTSSVAAGCSCEIPVPQRTEQRMATATNLPTLINLTSTEYTIIPLHKSRRVHIIFGLQGSGRITVAKSPLHSKSPFKIAEGANRRRKLVLTPDFVNHQRRATIARCPDENTHVV